MLSFESGISPIAQLSAYRLAYVSEQTNLACLTVYKKFNRKRARCGLTLKPRAW